MNLFRNHVRWFLIFWMFVISAISYLDRVNISIAGTSMEREYGFDHVNLGLVLSAFAWGYALFQAPGGRLADRFGPRRILAFGAVWWAVFTALTAAVPKGFRSAILVLMAIRFLLGTGEAVVYPAGNRLVAFWTPSRERGRANGFIFAGVGAGAGLAPPLITYILLHQGLALVVLDQRRDGAGGGADLVLAGPRQTGAAFLGHVRGGGDYSIRPARLC